MTEVLCITCPVLRPAGAPRQPNRPMVCDGDRTTLAGYLTDLPGLYAGLYEMLEPGRSGAEIRAKGFESQLPSAVDPLSMLAPGSMLPSIEGRPWAQDQIGDVPPLEQLWWWAEDWAQAFTVAMPGPYFAPVCWWLATWLPRACDDHPAVDEFAADLRRVTATLKAMTGGYQGERVGRCPQRLPDNSRCGTQLYVDPYVDVIECSRCHMRWRRRDGQWMHLRGQQLAAGVETVEAA